MKGGTHTTPLEPADALRLAVSWIAPLPEGRPNNQATCAYVPRDVYEQLSAAMQESMPRG